MEPRPNARYTLTVLTGRVDGPSTWFVCTEHSQSESQRRRLTCRPAVFTGTDPK